MKSSAHLNDPEKWASLAERLARCPEVTKYDTVDEREAWTLVHAFTDLESSFRIFLHEHLSKLVTENMTPEEIHDLLLDIGEEFQHILYHINDAKFYRELLEPLDPERG